MNKFRYFFYAKIMTEFKQGFAFVAVSRQNPEFQRTKLLIGDSNGLFGGEDVAAMPVLEDVVTKRIKHPAIHAFVVRVILPLVCFEEQGILEFGKGSPRAALGIAHPKSIWADAQVA